MATEPLAAPDAAPPRAKKPKAVIRVNSGARESRAQRLLKKQLPAIVVSGAVHVALIAAMIASDTLVAKPPAEVPSDQLLTVVAPDEKPVAEQNLTNPDIGLDAAIPAAIEAENLAVVNVQDAVQAATDPGALNAEVGKMTDLIPPTGLGDLSATIGAAGDLGQFAPGGGGGSGDAANPAFAGRGAATRSKMVAEKGGNAKSEAAVARGILWLARQQRKDGSWQYDGSSRDDTLSATALALLPFLAAGQTHKGTGPDNKYKSTVEAGLNYLLASQTINGKFKNVEKGDGYYMYSHAIATVTLCEALGMTGDTKLVRPAQVAVNLVVAAQAGNGSWGYKPGQQGDTSIVGWQIQALKAAKECKQLRVDNRAFEKASKFLDSVAAGPNLSRYGYKDPETDRAPLTAVGLLSRHYASGWEPTNPGMASGVAYLLDKYPPKASYKNIYYYYYATQAVHFFEGPEWTAWNGRMRDLLIDTQAKSGAPELLGTWEPDGELTGKHVGRLGATCFSLLTLEVYYRHLSLNKRDTAGLKELERGL